MERMVRGDYSLEDRPMLEAVVDRPEGLIVAPPGA